MQQRQPQNQSPQVNVQRLQAQVQATVQAQANALGQMQAQNQGQQQGSQAIPPQFTPQQQAQGLPQMHRSPANKVEQGGGGGMQVPMSSQDQGQQGQQGQQGPNGQRMQNAGINVTVQSSPQQPPQQVQNQVQGQGQGQSNVPQQANGNGNNQLMNQQQFGRGLTLIMQNMDYYADKMEKGELNPEQARMVSRGSSRLR